MATTNENYFEVVDNKTFTAYREKRAEWDKKLNSDSEYYQSVKKQNSSLTWELSIFLTINDFRNRLIKLAKNRADKEVQYNSTLINFIDYGFVDSISTKIRKITEIQNKKSRYKIISLRSVIDDIIKEKSLLTRECFLAYYNLPYNAVESERNFKISVRGFSSYGHPLNGPLAYLNSIDAHKKFDRLSGKNANNRLYNDLIKDDIFDNIMRLLDNCKNVKEFVDKVVVHSEDLSDEEKIKKIIKCTSLKSLTHCIKAIYQAKALIEDLLCWNPPGFAMQPRFLIWKNIDKKIISSEKMAQKIYDKNVNKMRKWEKEALNSI
jgi:hypothetical protein